MKYFSLLILLILVLGVSHRLLLTSGGNFLFNMDNARDLVEVREMVELGKLRLIGPTSGIEGVFTGPGWYYLLIVPYLISGGHPYSVVVMLIGVWVLGGIFLLKMMRERGMLATVMGGLLWISSPYLVLATSYGYHPSMVVLLSPVLIYCLWRYLVTGGLRYSLLSWLLGGLFFQFEMAAGLMVPLVVISVGIYGQKWSYFKSRHFWLGGLIFGLLLLPQLLFELRYQFFMTQSLLRHLGSGDGWMNFSRISSVILTYQSVLSATLLNNIWLVGLFGVGLTVFVFSRKRRYEPLLVVILLTILVPLIGHLLVPLKIMPWHLGIGVGGVIVLVGYLFGEVRQPRVWVKLVVIVVAVLVWYWSITGLELDNQILNRGPNGDASAYVNELTAVDYIYQQADGQRFKVYSYLPSVIDYPYQYLIWWHGGLRYGYLPTEYAYSPNKTAYIKQKEALKLPRGSRAFEPDQESGLIFLIKEPDNQQRRELWENQFKNLTLLKTVRIGPLLVETRLSGSP